MSATTVFALNVLAAWYLVGLIWMVQIVHYNLFDRVGADQFVQYESDHNRLITPIVGIPMLIEIVTAGMLLAASPVGFPRWAAVFSMAMIVLIWLSTALIQVPCHNQLMSGFDAAVYKKLVVTNWIRTGLWTARGILVGYFLLQMLRTNK